MRAGVLTLIATKWKHRYRLAAPGHDFRCVMSKVFFCTDQLMEKNYFLKLGKPSTQTHTKPLKGTQAENVWKSLI